MQSLADFLFEENHLLCRFKPGRFQRIEHYAAGKAAGFKTTEGKSMAIDKELLDILCCPQTKVELAVLPKKRIDAVNQQIAKGGVKFTDGKRVEEALQEALITVDEKTIYRIDDEIPIMLVEMGIPVNQFGTF